MTEIYRITGMRRNWKTGETDRVTVQRSQKADYAYYEDLAHAKRGLTGLKASNSYYKDFRIEIPVANRDCVITWEAIDV